MHACHQAAARRRTNRAPGVKIGEPDSLRSHFVNIRGADDLLPVTFGFTITKVIVQDDYDIRLPVFFFMGLADCMTGISDPQ